MSQMPVNVTVFLCRFCAFKWMLGKSCSMADLQQFFTGKLYVLMYQLKLPAEELLWSALNCIEDPSIPMSDMRTMTQSYPVSYSQIKTLLLMRHVPALRFLPWHLPYHVTKALHRGHLTHFRLVFMIAVMTLCACFKDLSISSQMYILLFLFQVWKKNLFNF